MTSLSGVGEELRESMTHEAWWSRVNGSNFGRFTVSSTLWWESNIVFTVELLKIIGKQMGRNEMSISVRCPYF